MLRTSFLLALTLMPVVAMAQDDTADTADTGGIPQEPLELPAGTVLHFPDETNGELTLPSLVFSVEVPSLTDGISKVPGGSFLLLHPEDGSFQARMVEGKSWLLPDRHYTEALAKARELEIVSPALERCTERALEWQDRTYSALDTCSKQFGEDEALVAELTSDVAEWETRALVAEEKVKRSRKAAVVAWSITGGILFGGIVVTSVAVGL